MAEIVNLRRARKAKARGEKDKAAEANRVAHGAPKSLKKLARARREQAEHKLAGHALEKDQPDN